MTNKIRIVTNPKRCIGSGACVLAAPELFTQGNDGLVRVLLPHASQDFFAKAMSAAAACPGGVIKIETADETESE